MEHGVTIRQATLEDAEALALIGAATFLDTYAGTIAGQDIVAHCAKRHAVEVYRRWLSGAANTLYLAEAPGGAPIGYLVLTPATLPEAAAHADDMEVQRIYALSRYHGAALGHRLMAEAIARSQAQGARRLVLGVMKTNARALAFYERQGFSAIGARRFTVGRSVFDDLIMGRMC